MADTSRQDGEALTFWLSEAIGLILTTCLASHEEYAAYRLHEQLEHIRPDGELVPPLAERLAQAPKAFRDWIAQLLETFDALQSGASIREIAHNVQHARAISIAAEVGQDLDRQHLAVTYRSQFQDALYHQTAFDMHRPMADEDDLAEDTLKISGARNMLKAMDLLRRYNADLPSIKVLTIMEDPVRQRAESGVLFVDRLATPRGMERLDVSQSAYGLLQEHRPDVSGFLEPIDRNLLRGGSAGG